MSLQKLTVIPDKAEYIVIVFDICSSSKIMGELLQQQILDNWVALIEGLSDFLDKKKDELDIIVYKFIGDGWILLVEVEKIDYAALFKFLDELSCTYEQLHNNYILTYRNIETIGLTFGLDKGKLQAVTFPDGKIEYIGRPINIASRLQGEAKNSDSHQQYFALLSEKNFRFENNELSERPNKLINLNLRNIYDSDKIPCRKILIKPDYFERTFQPIHNNPQCMDAEKIDMKNGKISYLRAELQVADYFRFGFRLLPSGVPFKDNLVPSKGDGILFHISKNTKKEEVRVTLYDEKENPTDPISFDLSDETEISLELQVVEENKVEFYVNKNRCYPSDITANCLENVYMCAFNEGKRPEFNLSVRYCYFDEPKPTKELPTKTNDKLKDLFQEILNKALEFETFILHDEKKRLKTAIAELDRFIQLNTISIPEEIKKAVKEFYTPTNDYLTKWEKRHLPVELEERKQSSNEHNKYWLSLERILTDFLHNC